MERTGRKRRATLLVCGGPPFTTTLAIMDTVSLYRPIGPKELELIEKSGWKEFPPRLFHQPIFYPVLNEEYATMIARDWNVKESGSGYVTRFQVRADYVARFEVQTVGGSICKELWVPAEELAEFNRNIVGQIEVLAKFHGSQGATDC